MTTYYVATNGSNSQAGTIDKPFASLQYAHNLAKPGDTIFIRGTYNLTTGMQLTKDGTSGQPITVSNYGNEKVIFDGAKMSSGYYKGFMLDMSSVFLEPHQGPRIQKRPRWRRHHPRCFARGARAADGSLPNSDFLHLASGSDLIDKGIKVRGISYSGNSPDLGAVDWNGNGTPTPDSDTHPDARSGHDSLKGDERER